MIIKTVTVRGKKSYPEINYRVETEWRLFGLILLYKIIENKMVQE